jgi:hypothetical protein
MRGVSKESDKDVFSGQLHVSLRTSMLWRLCSTHVTVALGIVAFVVAEAVPFFGTLIGLLAAIAYAPMAVSPRDTSNGRRMLTVRGTPT